MDQPQRIPAQRVDSMASQLKGSLQRRRPRPWLIVGGALLAAIALLVLLAWWLYDQPALPRLEVVVFDAVAAPDEPARVAAQLAFPRPGDLPQSLLAGRDLVFLNLKAAMMPGQQGHQVKTASDAEGRAVVDWPAPAAGKSETIIVRYVDVRQKHGSSDQATLFAWAKDRKILLVDVDEALYQKPPAPAPDAPADNVAPPAAAQALREAERRGYRIGYLAAASASPLEYRVVRGWVTGQWAGKDGLPIGPVLGRRDYPSSIDADQARRERLDDLRQRLGTNVTFVTRTAFAAGAATANQLRAIVIEPGENVPGAMRVRGWAEVPSVLPKE